MRFLSYNIQAAIASDSYLSYLSRLHRQVLPSAAKQQVLQRIADYIAAFDVVCLQEIDLGGLRNGFNCQAQQLTAAAGFAHHISQTNRVVGKLSRHGNLILSRHPLRTAANEVLPSRIKGRGILAAAVSLPEGEIVFANVHLSLGQADQAAQIRRIRELLSPYPNVCLSGDFNCPPDAPVLSLLTEDGYRRLGNPHPTYPSWRPSQTLDHIFVKGRLNGSAQVEPFTASDHLPVSATLKLNGEHS